MDYRKPAVFGENWSPSRYRVLPYFAREKELLLQPWISHILDVGCANGWNMSRFNQYVEQKQLTDTRVTTIGLDRVPQRVELAREHGPVMVASGLKIPVVDESIDVVYIQHVLHHIGDVPGALREACRVLRPGGYLFLIETVEDSPIIHWGRRMYSNWLGDEINAPFKFKELQELIAKSGYQITSGEQYSIFFWIWEIVPDQIPFMERLTPLFVLLERLLVQFLRQYGAHCYLVAQKL